MPSLTLSTPAAVIRFGGGLAARALGRGVADGEGAHGGKGGGGGEQAGEGRVPRRKVLLPTYPHGVPCTHLDQILVEPPESVEGCEDCLRTGDTCAPAVPELRARRPL